MQYTIKSITLAIITLSVLLPGSFSAPCKDDPGYTFGFTGNAPGERRTCAWLNQLKQKGSNFANQANQLCGMQWRHNIVGQKCPETCDGCIPLEKRVPPGQKCIDEVMRDDAGRIVDWHDSFGKQYHCKYYEQGDNCSIFGNAFRNQGMTAKDACCKCGGGINVPERRLYEEKVRAKKGLRQKNTVV